MGKAFGACGAILVSGAYALHKRHVVACCYVIPPLGFAAGAWRLDGLEDKVGRYEPGRGAHEPRSQWCLRSLDRLAGRVTYTTPEPHVP